MRLQQMQKLTRTREEEIRGTLDSCLMPATVAELLAEIDRLRGLLKSSIELHHDVMRLRFERPKGPVA